MTRISGSVKTIKLPYGFIRCPMFDVGHKVGDRLVPSPIEVDFPGGDGQPGLYMLIEVIDNVPRLTELSLKMREGGREIRALDLKNIHLEEMIEDVVSSVSGEITSEEDGTMVATYGAGEDRLRSGAKVIAEARKGSRRALTPARLKRVADTYNAQESGGLEAVEVAFQVSRSTAARYIRKARDAGLIEAANG